MSTCDVSLHYQKKIGTNLKACFEPALPYQEYLKPITNEHDTLTYILMEMHLAFYLRLPEATRNDLDNSLQELRNRYAGTDQRNNFELDLQSRKFDPIKEQPDDFLTDLQGLANLAIVDDNDAGRDRTDERQR